jgi:ABC transporter substrate binding protein
VRTTWISKSRIFFRSVFRLTPRRSAARIWLPRVAEDPVRLGLVKSLARPGGNLTGINFLSAELAAKRLEFLRELLPQMSRLAVLLNPTGPTPEITLKDVEAARRHDGTAGSGLPRRQQPGDR